uniref:Glycosyltransferase family 1 protein n=1 Tax=Moniliophthora roreri TaxID=221103 RepID=A0A0W0F2B8_MONRR
MVCSVHHGGASSFFETISVGVPHVILPVWYNAYGYGRRVELLRVGVWGSPTSAPYAEAKEFGAALVKVVGNSHNGGELKEVEPALKEIWGMVDGLMKLVSGASSTGCQRSYHACRLEA